MHSWAGCGWNFRAVFGVDPLISYVVYACIAYCDDITRRSWLGVFAALVKGVIGPFVRRVFGQPLHLAC